MRLAAALTTGLLALQAAAPLLTAPRRARSPRTGRTATWLAEAGTGLGPAAFAGVRALSALTALALALSVSGSPAVSLPPAVAGWWLPRAVLTRRRAQRLRRLAVAWPDGLRDLGASVSAGLSLPQAVDALARGGPEPLRELFARFPGLQAAFGLRPALEQIRDEAADPATDRVVEVLLLAHERGGRVLPELIADLAEAAARDLHLQERLATAQLELRINARAVFALPWLVLCALTARPGPFRAFYASPRALPVVIAGGVLSLAGIWLVERLGRPPIEPRVLVGEGSAP